MGILTYIYLIRHSEQLKIKGEKINNEEKQLSNEKIVLSVDGEKRQKK